MSVISTDSVISSVSSSGVMPDSVSASRTSATMSLCCSCLTERLTLIVSGGSLGASRSMIIAWRQASRSTQRPIGTIRPVSSANAMNWSGAIRPRSG